MTRRASPRHALLLFAALLLSVGVEIAHAAFVATTTNTGNVFTAPAVYPRCYNDEVVTDNPISFWKLDETSNAVPVVDSRGANDGTFVSGPAVQQAGALADVAGKSVSFNGTNYVNVPDSASLDTGDTLTVEFWLKMNSLGTTQQIIDRGTGAWSLAISSIGSLVFQKAGTGIITTTNAIAAIADTNRFHHIVVTKSGATSSKIYLDGVDRTAAVTDRTLTNSADPLRVGTASPGASLYLNAHVDGVAVYGTALTETRVRAHFNSGRCYVDEVAADSPVARWRMDDPTGSGVALDDIGTSHANVKSGVTLGTAGAITGDTNTAMTFNGTTGHLEVANPAGLNPATWTVEAWAYPTGGTGAIRTVIASTDTSLRSYEIRATDTNLWSLRCSISGGAAVLTGPAVRLNEWTHLVGAYDSSVLRFFVNGVEVGSGGTACLASDGLRPLRIGGGSPENDALSYQFPGSIDEVAVYDNAISATRVAAHYAAGVPFSRVGLSSNPLPVSYWRLGEASAASAVADARAANPGTYVLSPTMGRSGAIAGDSDTAVTLNGTSQYVTIPDSASLDTGNVFSAELWMRRSGTAVAQTLLSKGNNAYSIRISASHAIELWKNSGGVNELIVTSTVTLNEYYNYHHIAVTKSGGTVRIYLDGDDVTGTVTDVTLLNSANPLNIGSASPTAGSYANGTIDEVAIYSSALTAQQVKLRYDAGIRAPR